MSELSIERHYATLPERPRAPDAGAPMHPSILNAVELVRDDLQLVESELRLLLTSDVALIPVVCGHLAFAGGKRLRPLLTLLVAKAIDFPRAHAIKIAAMGELLHTATLLHDDVVDAGDFRRGRPSARYKYGNGMAVLTGDFCLARALECAAEIGDIRTLRSIAHVVTRMSEGEVAQLQVAGDWHLDRQRYYMVIERKTAELIAWCSALSGLLAPKSDRALRQFGIHVGYAFQIADDIIDYRYDVATSGKARAQDLREGKLTLPVILAAEQDPTLLPRLKSLLSHKAPLPDASILDIVSHVESTGALQAATKIANEHIALAQRELSMIPAGPAKSALVTLTQHVVGRTQ